MLNSLKRKFKGGVHPPEFKNTQDLETVQMPLPKEITIPMLMHIGEVCVPVVKKGDAVFVGQIIGTSEKFVSAPIHASVSGVVKEVRPLLYPGGFDVMTVVIEPDGLQTLDPSLHALTDYSLAEKREKVRESGIVGLGGAGFPTSIKLSPPPEKKLDIFIVNAAECEPYITSDYREMLENTEGVIAGTRLVMDLTGVQKGYIGIESNKPKAIQKLKESLKNDPTIEVVSLPTRYPQGGEKQLIYAITKRVVPSRGLPSDVGVLVHNVSTVSFLPSYFATGIPLIKRKITVDGGAVKNPMNVEVPIGTHLRDVFEFCGGFHKTPYKIIMGGPMMGVSQFSLDNPIIKQTNAILALTEEEAHVPEEESCIRCGKCIEVCPMDLLPLQFHANVRLGRIEETVKYNIQDCIECGSCSYTCPSKLYLVQSIRYAKAELKKNQQ
jgi:Na+-translocating ferredoxin:NAD+ oxidoreductase subunit C